MAWLSGWGKRIAITISNTNVDSNLTHFPLPLVLGTSVGTGSADVSAVFDELTSDANKLKIAVTESDGTSELYVEIEKWDDANESAVLWVSKSDFVISSSSNTTVYLYYDSSHADNTDKVGVKNSTVAQSVWVADAIAVYHMADGANTSGIYDSTDNNTDGTKGGAGAPAVTTTAQLGYAQAFDGSNDYIGLGSAIRTALATSNAFALSVWVYNTDLTVDASVFGGWGAEGHKQLLIYMDTDGAADGYRAIVYDDDAATISTSADANNATEDTWQHLFVTYDGAALKLYVAAVEDETASGGNGIAASGTQTYGIGSDTGDSSDRPFPGTIDELQVYDDEMSVSWGKALFESQRDNLISWGSEETNVTNGVVAISSISSSVFGGLRLRPGIGAILSVPTLSFVGNRTASAISGIESISSLTIAGDRLRFVISTIESISSIAADGDRVRLAIVAINSISSLIANAAGGAIVYGIAAIQSIASLALDANRKASASSEIDSVASLTASGGRIASAIAYLQSVASLDADPTRVKESLAIINAVSSLDIAAFRNRLGVASITSVSSLDATGDLFKLAAVAISSIASLAIDGDRIASAIAAIESISSVIADASSGILATVAILAVASMTSAGVKVTSGEVTITAVSSADLAALAYISQTFGYTGTLTAGDVLVIDTDAMTVKLNGSSTRPLMTGRFPLLGVGSNILVWEDGGEVPDLTFETKHEPRYL